MAGTAEGEAAAQREEEAKKQYTRTLSKVKLLPSFLRRGSSRNYLLLSPVDDSALDSEDTSPACLPAAVGEIS